MDLFIIVTAFIAIGVGIIGLIIESIAKDENKTKVAKVGNSLFYGSFTYTFGIVSILDAIIYFLLKTGHTPNEINEMLRLIQNKIGNDTYVDDWLMGACVFSIGALGALGLMIYTNIGMSENN